jgi:hypothetical protein
MSNILLTHIHLHTSTRLLVKGAKEQKIIPYHICHRNMVIAMPSVFYSIAQKIFGNVGYFASTHISHTSTRPLVKGAMEQKNYHIPYLPAQHGITMPAFFYSAPFRGCLRRLMWASTAPACRSDSRDRKHVSKSKF